jgi:hypothetical protein
MKYLKDYSMIEDKTVNPKMSITELKILEHNIDENIAKVEDYIRLDNYLVFLGSREIILETIREYKMEDYEDFVFQRKINPHGDINCVIGTAMGITCRLRRHISGK